MHFPPSTSTTLPNEPLTILLVDDDEAARYLGQRLLRPYADQVQLQLATNGAEALEALQQPAAPGRTLVLLDLNMPVMDGFEFLEEYQHLPQERQQHTRVVVVSSSELPTDQQRVKAFGAGFVNKPLNPTTITELLTQFRPV